MNRNQQFPEEWRGDNEKPFTKGREHFLEQDNNRSFYSCVLSFLANEEDLDLHNKSLKSVSKHLLVGNGYETRQSSLLYVIVLFFGLDPAQNTTVVYSELRNSPIETCWLRNSCTVYEGKTKDCAGSWTFQHKSCHLCLFL